MPHPWEIRAEEARRTCEESGVVATSITNETSFPELHLKAK